MSIDSEKLTKFLTKLESIDNLLKKYKISSNAIDNYTSNTVEKLHEIAEVIPTDNTVILSEHEFNTVIKKSSVSKIIEFNNSEKSRETTNDDNQVDHIDDIKKIKKSENSDKVYQINIDDLKTLKENSVYKDHSKYIAKPLSYHYIMLYAIVKSIHTLFGVNIQQHTIEETQQEGGGIFDSVKDFFNPNAGKPSDGDQVNDDEKVSDGEQANSDAEASVDDKEKDIDINANGDQPNLNKKASDSEDIDNIAIGDPNDDGDPNDHGDQENDPVIDDANDRKEENLDDINDDNANDVVEETDSVEGIGREDTDNISIDDDLNDIGSRQSSIEEISSESLFFSIRSLLTTIKDSEVSTQQEKFIEFLNENIQDTDTNKILGIYDVYNIYTKNKELFGSENTDKKLIEKIDQLKELLNSINEKYTNIKSVKDSNYTSNYGKLYKDIDGIINPKTTFSVTHIRDQYISKIKDQLNLLILENKKVKKDSIYYNSLKYLLTNNKLYDILININIIIVDFNIEILKKLDTIIDGFIKSIKEEKKAEQSVESQYNESSNEFKDFDSIDGNNTDDIAMDVDDIKLAIDKLPRDEAEKVKDHMENLNSDNTNNESIKSEQQQDYDDKPEEVDKQESSKQESSKQELEEQEQEQQEQQTEQQELQELDKQKQEEKPEKEEQEQEQQQGKQEQQDNSANAKEEDKKPEKGGKTRLYIKDKGLKKSKRRIKRSINNRRKIKKNTKKIKKEKK